MHTQPAGKKKILQKFLQNHEENTEFSSYIHRGIHKQESGPVLPTQGLRGFEGLGKKFAAGILLHEGDTQNTQCKNSSL